MDRGPRKEADVPTRSLDDRHPRYPVARCATCDHELVHPSGICPYCATWIATPTLVRVAGLDLRASRKGAAAPPRWRRLPRIRRSPLRRLLDRRPSAARIRVILLAVLGAALAAAHVASL